MEERKPQSESDGESKGREEEREGEQSKKLLSGSENAAQPKRLSLEQEIKTCIAFGFKQIWFHYGRQGQLESNPSGEREGRKERRRKRDGEMEGEYGTMQEWKEADYHAVHIRFQSQPVFPKPRFTVKRKPVLHTITDLVLRL